MRRFGFFLDRRPPTYCDDQRNIKTKAYPIMATIPYGCIGVIPIPKRSPPPPSAKEMKKVSQKDVSAHMESVKVSMLCSSRPNPSRRNRPALPPEEEPAWIVACIPYVVDARWIFNARVKLKGKGETPPPKSINVDRQNRFALATSRQGGILTIN